MTVSEDVSAGAAGATDGHTRQAHTAAKLQNSPERKEVKSRGQCCRTGDWGWCLDDFVRASASLASLVRKRRRSLHKVKDGHWHIEWLSPATEGLLLIESPLCQI